MCLKNHRLPTVGQSPSSTWQARGSRSNNRNSSLGHSKNSHESTDSHNSQNATINQKAQNFYNHTLQFILIPNKRQQNALCIQLSTPKALHLPASTISPFGRFSRNPSNKAINRGVKLHIKGLINRKPRLPLFPTQNMIKDKRQCVWFVAKKICFMFPFYCFIVARKGSKSALNSYTFYIVELLFRAAPPLVNYQRLNHKRLVAMIVSRKNFSHLDVVVQNLCHST